MVDTNLNDGFDLYTAQNIDLDCEGAYTLDVGDVSVTTVAKDRFVMVGKQQMTQVKNDIWFLSETASFNVAAETDVTYQAKGNWTETVGGNKTETITGDYTLMVKNKDIINTAKDSWVTCDATSGMKISASFELFLAAKTEIGLAAELAIKAGVFVELKASLETSITAGLKLEIGGASSVGIHNGKLQMVPTQKIAVVGGGTIEVTSFKCTV